MNRFRKALCVALVLLLLVASVPAVPVADLGFGITASALNATGKCGKTATYTFDSATGKLVISGTGAIAAEAFVQNKEIKNVIIGDGITEIGADAFAVCYYLTNVDIPYSVTTIGSSAFCNCDYLTNVDIPDGVTTIGSGVFMFCNKLSRVGISNNVTTISREAFAGCTGLTSVDIPDSVTTIGDKAFSNCSGLESVNIPKSVTYIGEEAFRYCPSLTDVYYAGSEVVWDTIEIGENNTGLDNATIHFGEEYIGCEHEYLWVPGTKSTCIYAGFSGHYECQKCGRFFRNDANRTEVTLEELTKPIDPTNHVTTEVIVKNQKDATCTDAGYTGDTYHKCCGELKMAGTVIPATGHKWQAGYCKDCGTCCEHDWDGNICKSCGYTCVNHEYNNPTCQDEAICYICGNKVADKDPRNHVSAETYIKNVKEAKCYEPGYSGDEYYYCCDTLKKVGNTVTVDHCYETTLSQASESKHGYRCTNVGCTAYDVSRLADHDYIINTVVKSATCEEEGQAIFKCDACNAAKTDKLKKLDHTFTTTATKKDDNTHGKKCMNCDAFDAVEAHCWEIKSTELSPTCTEDGVGIYECKDCKATMDDVIFALGHDMSKIEGYPATCTESGMNTYYACKRCDKFFKDKNGRIETTETDEIVAPYGHDYWDIDSKQETCTEDGYWVWKCFDCGHTYTETIPATGHSYPSTWSVLITPDCQNTGFAVKVCFGCHDVIAQVVPKAGHADNDGDSHCDTCNCEIIVEEPEKPAEKPEEKPCNCDCHAGGIKAFFFKLINFFAKIFDKNARVCDCGKAH